MKNHLAIRLFGDSVIRGTRQGSALLIVLGMVSFMVVSAVSFSMYMRTSRMPSSYLRRGAATRHLLKSALANAIDRLDGTWRCTLDSAIGYDIEEGYVEGIYDDLYPGLNPKGLSTQEADYPYTGNRFDHHVFAPFVEADPDVTVSTLTLEGLAYLPPALVNDVRIYSRRTLTARWSNLSYEFGRYAFCAVDVSDCFDINKVRASGRTSAPGQRIGFSSMFQKGSTWSDLDGSLATEFNTLANKIGDAGIPYVSMADFNIFNGKTSFTPFCRFIGKSGDLSFTTAGDTAANGALFTTDTWFPPTNAVTNIKRYSLDGGDQPFEEFGGKLGVEDVLRQANGGTPAMKLFRDRLGGVGMVSLYDYLDADNVPTSYALPTTETAPMVCALGVEGAGGFKPSIKKGTATRTRTLPDAANPNRQFIYTATPYVLNWGADSLHVIGLAAFPFKRLKDKPDCSTSFKAEGLVRVFLASEDLNAHLVGSSPLVPRETGDWKNGMSGGIITRTVNFIDRFSEFKDDSSRNAVQSFEGDLDLPNDSPTLFWEVVKETQQKDGDGNWQPVGSPVTYYSMDGVKGQSNASVPYDETGKEAGWWSKLAAQAEMLPQGTTVPPTDNTANLAAISALTYKPHIAVWVKIVDNNPADGQVSTVVDLVPAFLNDDKIWGNHNESTFEEVEAACCATRPPLLDFRPTDGFAWGISGVPAPGAAAPSGDIAQPVIFAVDPRYNFAPEAWYAPSGVSLTDLQDGQRWLNEIQPLLGKNGRDPDIFMFTSDQEYLQAMGELQFLPWTRNLSEGPGMILENLGKWEFDAKAFKTSAADVLKFMPGMWQTYSAVDGDPIYNLGDRSVEFASSRNDFRVNPYTQDERVFMTVIANTPYDYYVASTNENRNLFGKCDYRNGKPTTDEARTHAFNSKTSVARWTDTRDDSKLQDIAYALQDGFSAAAENWGGGIGNRPSWESVYDSFAWYDGKTGDDQKKFLGVDMDTVLHGVDRKFLHSFWRECFGNRQQLFLVFLRAEQLTVGGSGTAAMANAQTGARGVALVWRDPEPPAYERNKRPIRSSVRNINAWKPNGKQPAPHRTRVLFYHQFD